MPKVGMGPVRRSQLIQATLESVHEHGLAHTTVSKISKFAGVSTGVISHYFGGKDELLEATMRHMLTKLGEGVVARSRQASTAREKIVAIIEGNFDYEQIKPESATTWLSFWSQAMHKTELARLQRVNMRRLHSNLKYHFRQCLTIEKAEEAALSLAALIDGLWLRGVFAEGGFDSRRARNITLNHMNELLEKAN